MNRKPACSLKGTEVHEVLLFPQGRIKQMVKGCWNTRPAVRPSFADLLYYLENNVSTREIIKAINPVPIKLFETFA